MANSESKSQKIDFFRHHLDRVLTDSDIEHLSKFDYKKSIKYSSFGEAIFSKSASIDIDTDDQIDEDVFSPMQLRPNLRGAIDSIDLSVLQQDLLSILTKYKDLFYSDFSISTSRNRSDEIVFAYSLHALNHVLKSRHRIFKNNTKLNQISISDGKSINEDIDKSKIDRSILGDDDDGDQFRDQGLTRPKVLILLPFRYVALNVVKSIIDLLFANKSIKKKAPILHKKRFFNEYDADEVEKDDEEEKEKSKIGKRPRLERPLDYKETFRGNIDDCFRLGLSFGKGGSLKLYTEFYASDIILASPLGLRMALGAESEKEYDYDFLSSIELLILDRTDIFQMQNWSHVLYILDHLNRQPKNSHGIDFSRVRQANLNGRAKFFRQTLIFSSIVTPELKSIFHRCQNFQGRISAVSNEKNSTAQSGSLSRVIVPLPHAFQRFDVENLASESEKRYEFFLEKILPQYTESSMSGTLIFIPSYYDFVRLRNYFKKNDNSISAVQICEYTSQKKISSARDLFFHGDKHFLLYTERFHFYHRYKIRGVRNLIFYQLPAYAHFYNEMCNVMLEEKNSKDKNRDKAASLTCAVLFSKFDALRLAGVLGHEKANELLKTEKSVHMMFTE